MSVIPKNAKTILCTAILLVSATAVRADNRIRVSDSMQHLQLAQQNAEYCRNWAAQIRSAQNSYNSSCSGSLSPQRLQECERWRAQIQNDTQRYNSQCR